MSTFVLSKTLVYDSIGVQMIG
uniref:Uncharacterized protein n=1 Tax=Arundo donax TaxID=35708 RepID=A0A0A8Y9X2_ARUDO